MKRLGLIYDTKLKWDRHITELYNKCKGKLTIIKNLSSIKWGADRDILIDTYKAIV